MRWSLRTEGVCYQIVGIPKAVSIPVNDSGLVSAKNMPKIAWSVWVWIRRRFVYATENIQSLNQIQHWAVRFPHLIHRNLEVLVIWRNVSKPRCFVLFTGLGGCKSPLWIWGRAMPIRWWVLADQHLLEIRLFFCLVELWEGFFFGATSCLSKRSIAGACNFWTASCQKLGLNKSGQQEIYGDYMVITWWLYGDYMVIMVIIYGDSVGNGGQCAFVSSGKKLHPGMEIRL